MLVTRKEFSELKGIPYSTILAKARGLPSTIPLEELEVLTAPRGKGGRVKGSKYDRISRSYVLPNTIPDTTPKFGFREALRLI